MTTIPHQSTIEESTEEFLAKNMTERRRNVINALEKISGDGDATVRIYKTAIFLSLKSDLPAIELVLSHCLSELINALLRRDKIEEKDELERLRIFFEQSNMTTYHGSSTKEILSQTTKDCKDYVNKFRHYRGNLYRNAPEILDKITDIENIILSLGSRYISKLRLIEDTLTKTNQQPFKNPGNNAKLALTNLTQNTEEYFFQKLENPEWIHHLKKELFFKTQIIIFNQIETHHLTNSVYLVKICEFKPEEVFQIAKLFLSECLKGNKNISSTSLQAFFQISQNFPNDQNNFSKEIAEYFNLYINKCWTAQWLHTKSIKAFLQNLIGRGFSELALKIIESLLKLDPKIEFKQLGTWRSVNVKFENKFAYGQLRDFYYDEFLKDVRDFLPDHSYRLFEIFYYTLRNAIEKKDFIQNRDIGDLEKIDENICLARSAIEGHEQDSYKTDVQFRIISAIRDAAEFIFKNNHKKSADVIKLLESKLSNGYQPIIFARIVMHLLRQHPNYDRKLIAKYLTNEKYFDNSKPHHEYYQLLKQEFSVLDDEDKDKIFALIDAGPTYDKEENHSRQWKFTKLHCIKEGLSGERKKQYQKLAKEFEEPRNPDFTTFTTISSWSGENYPTAANDLTKKSLSEIITYLNDKKAEAGRYIAFDELIRADFNKNPHKYLDGIRQFKKIKNPIYINVLIYAVEKFEDKNFDHWKAIIDLGKSIANHKDVEEFWTVRKPLSWLIMRIFKQKNEQTKELLILEKDIFEVLAKFTLSKDFGLEENLNQTIDKLYYNKAINSAHGGAFETLIEFALWLARNEKSEQASKLITPVLTKLLKESKYLETWSIFGRYLPWLILINKKWVVKNLDKILPETEQNKFDAAWLTYINFVQPFDDAFAVLKEKYLYVLQNPNLIKDNEEEHGGKLGESIAALYGRGRIELKDKIITTLFSKKNSIEAAAAISIIGRWSENEKNQLSSEFLERCQALWNWIRKNIKGKETSYLKEIEAFTFWYSFGAFDRKWAIKCFLENIKILANAEKVRAYLFFANKQLVKDIKIYRKEVEEIMRILLDRKTLHHENIELAKIYFDNFEDDEFKDQFCEKYGLDENFKVIAFRQMSYV